MKTPQINPSIQRDDESKILKVDILKTINKIKTKLF